MYGKHNRRDLGINAAIVQDALWGILTGAWDTEGSALEYAEVRTFMEAEIMTDDKGLVITLPDSTEYRLTIVKSR